MKIISSQHYINYNIVDSKLEELADAEVLEIEAYDAGEIDGEEYAVLFDKHHTLYAAKELGIKIEVVVVNHPEGLTGQKLLEEQWMDGDWYYVLDSDPEARRLVW